MSEASFVSKHAILKRHLAYKMKIKLTKSWTLPILSELRLVCTWALPWLGGVGLTYTVVGVGVGLWKQTLLLFHRNRMRTATRTNKTAPAMIVAKTPTFIGSGSGWAVIFNKVDTRVSTSFPSSSVWITRQDNRLPESDNEAWYETWSSWSVGTLSKYHSKWGLG